MKNMITVAFTLIVLTGCNAESDTTSPMVNSYPKPSSSASELHADAAFLAQAIAAALADSETRAHLRDDMRDSRVTDHKLLLKD
ncbi:MAG: hypothetical protein ABJB66_12090 [Gemmatimonadaceae bacterium]